MPNYKTHLCGGFFTYAVLLYFLLQINTTGQTAVQWLLCCLIGSLFPDVDTKSKIQKIFYVSLLIVFIFLAVNNQNQLLIYLSFIGITPLIVNHRTIFHKGWFILLLGAGAAFISVSYFPHNRNDILISTCFFVAGAISHIWLDMGFKRIFRL